VSITKVRAFFVSLANKLYSAIITPRRWNTLEKVIVERSRKTLRRVRLGQGVAYGQTVNRERRR